MASVEKRTRDGKVTWAGAVARPGGAAAQAVIR
jgi:hypothetical protein